MRKPVKTKDPPSVHILADRGRAGAIVAYLVEGRLEIKMRVLHGGRRHGSSDIPPTLVGGLAQDAHEDPIMAAMCSMATGNVAPEQVSPRNVAARVAPT